MSEHRASISWQNTADTMSYDDYSRDHTWSVKGGRLGIPVSAAPAYKGSEAALDPEEALVGALSSCHMLTFLAIASRRRLVVAQYEDDAVGMLAPNEAGRLAVTQVTLRPRVQFAPGAEVSAEEFARLHARAHEQCFIANSVTTVVSLEPVLL